MRAYVFLTSVALLALACNLGTPAATPVPDPAVSTLAAPSPTAEAPAATETAPAIPPSPTVEPTPLFGSDSLEIYAVVDVAPDDVLNVRSGAGVSNGIVGTLPPYATGVFITGGGTAADGGTWVPIQHGALQGWANRHYLARQYGGADAARASRAAEVIHALQQRDFQVVAQWTHPSKGLRFSPYAYVGSGDLAFSASLIPGLYSDSTVYHWGNFDGSGEPIDLAFADYFERFVYDVDFAAPDEIAFNEFRGHGNTINNLTEAYPGAFFVEYHFPGFDPQYGGLDWRSLRLVFEQVNGEWVLVGIVHAEWTT